MCFSEPNMQEGAEIRRSSRVPLLEGPSRKKSSHKPHLISSQIVLRGYLLRIVDLPSLYIPRGKLGVSRTQSIQ
ncbi:hypothetical protein PAXRUDRAFT_825214 [Paxillus rubicundulus Ve08.2h10]|uniref:Uncharacterized protein n=1 Tax=Paxillus rubicundulus Ve08.2h10 TaxID=930991 RepID=A0A0D0EB57_9AGAM|nr:hypothetical protein PAXRUDRAFT_825214 [Paxillus rubicundulus Ve08.2h10]